MEIKFRHTLGEKLNHESLGEGIITIAAAQKSGKRYLLEFPNGSKTWVDEKLEEPKQQQQQQPDSKDRGDDKTGKAAKVASLLIAFLLWLTLGGSAVAQTYTATDGYVTQTQNAPTTNYSELVFSGAPDRSIRLLCVDYRSDTNTAMLNLYSGTAPYTVTGVINGTNLVVTSNAGIVTNQLCILQIGGTNWTATVLYTNQLTNVVLAGGATLGFTPLTNSVLWHCGNRVLFPVNVGTGQRIGPAVFSGQVRAPVAVRIDPGVVTSNKLSVTAYYGTAGSP